MTAGTYDITIEQGATFTRTLTWKDENEDAVNLTGYSARLQMRESVEAVDTFIDITSGNSPDDIALGGAAGTIIIAISATTTAALTQGGVYDLELVSGAGVVTRLLQGNVTLSKEVTR